MINLVSEYDYVQSLYYSKIHRKINIQANKIDKLIVICDQLLQHSSLNQLIDSINLDQRIFQQYTSQIYLYRLMIYRNLQIPKERNIDSLLAAKAWSAYWIDTIDVYFSNEIQIINKHLDELPHRHFVDYSWLQEYCQNLLEYWKLINGYDSNYHII